MDLTKLHRCKKLTDCPVMSQQEFLRRVVVSRSNSRMFSTVLPAGRIKIKGEFLVHKTRQKLQVATVIFKLRISNGNFLKFVLGVFPPQELLCFSRLTPAVLVLDFYRAVSTYGETLPNGTGKIHIPLRFLKRNGSTETLRIYGCG